MWRFVEDSSGTLQSSVRRERAFLSMWWAVQGSVAAGSVLTLVISATLVGSGVISLGTAFLLFQYVLLVSRPLEELVYELETVQKANGAMLRVAELIAVEPTIVDRGTTSPPRGSLAVRCRGVSFDYGDDRTILHDVDVDIAAGRSVGVVGRTGSGKTTFSRLLLRLVEATGGTVSLGGVPIADIPMAELRRRVALIPQEVELFEGTIRENVALFDPGPTDAAVEDALTEVGLDGLVAGGIHRPLGARGTGVSAGEAQLLALARVWLRRPDLVVLDEATARVDPETEARLQAAVAQLTAGRTTLIIAHRLSTLRLVDEVIVFDHGRIVEHDDRAVLAGDDGSRFRRLLALALEADDEHRTGGPAPGRVVQRWSPGSARRRLQALRRPHHSRYWHEHLAPVLAREPARAAIVLARLGGVHRLLHPAGGDGVRARPRLRRPRRRGHGRGLPVGAAAGRRRGPAHGLGPLRGDHVDHIVGAHADPAARQPAHGAGRQRWPGRRPTGRLGRRGDHPLPRRHRGRRDARRRHGRRLRRIGVHGGRRVPPRFGRRHRRRGAAAPAGRRGSGDTRPSTGASRPTARPTARRRRRSPAWSAT